MRACVGLFLCTAVLLLTTGCNFKVVEKSYLTPAAVNMIGYEAVVVGNFEPGTGTDATARSLRLRLVEEIRNTAGMRVLNREDINVITEEVRMELQGAAGSSSGNPRIGNLSLAHCLVAGEILEETRLIWRDAEGNETYNGHTIKAAFRVVDVESSEEIASRIVTSTKRWGAEAANIDNCIEDIVGQFMKEISPYPTLVKVNVYKQPESPNNTAGVAYFLSGDYCSAIDAFNKAYEDETRNPKTKPVRLSNAMYNCGLAYEFSGQFEIAKQCYAEANKKFPHSYYNKAIARATTRLSQAEDLLAQGVDYEDLYHCE